MTQSTTDELRCDDDSVEPKRARLTFEGISPDEVTVGFLTQLMEVSAEQGLTVEGIGVGRSELREEDEPEQTN